MKLMCRELLFDIRKFADAQHIASQVHLQRFVVDMHPSLSLCFSSRRHRTRLRLLLKVAVLTLHFGIVYGMAWALLAFPCQRMGWCHEACQELTPVAQDQFPSPCSVNTSLAFRDWRMYYLPPVPSTSHATTSRYYKDGCGKVIAPFDPTAAVLPREPCVPYCRPESTTNAMGEALDLRPRCIDTALAANVARQAETTGLFCFAQAQWAECEVAGVLPQDWTTRAGNSFLGLTVVMPLDMLASSLLVLKKHADEGARRTTCRCALLTFALFLVALGITIPIGITIGVSHRFYHSFLISFTTSWVLWQLLAIPQYVIVFYLRPLGLALLWCIVLPVSHCFTTPCRAVQEYFAARRRRAAMTRTSTVKLVSMEH